MEHSSTNSTNTQPSPQKKTVILAGATGHLGQRIAAHLTHSKANVIALVRKSSHPDQTALLKKEGVTLSEVDFDNPS